MPTLFVPAQLRPLAGGSDRVAVTGTTLRQVIDDLGRAHPGLRDALLDDGRINPALSLSVDNELVTTGLLTAVGESSEIHILPRISGG